MLRVFPNSVFGIRQLCLPEDVEQTLKILVMMPKQLASELASEEQAGPADNTLDAGMWVQPWLTAYKFAKS